MDAKELVERYIDPERLLEYLGFREIHEEGEDFRACCEIHGGNTNTSFHYNTDTNKWKCHACERKGDDYQLLQTMLGLTFPQAIMKMAEIFNVDIGNLRLVSFTSQSDKEQKEWKKLMKKKLKQNESLSEYVMPDMVRKSVKSFRNFDKEFIQSQGAFFTPEVKLLNKKQEEYSLYNRFVIPVTFNDRLIGMCLRRTKEVDIQKWSHQGFESGNCLFNYDNCRDYLLEHPEVEDVILCEGVFDVWRFMQQGIFNVVCTFGAHLTTNQAGLLQRICTEITLAFDGDDAGRRCTQSVIETEKHHFTVYVIPFEEGKDPGNTDDLPERYKNKILYTRWC